jgi:hypothetical protein
MYLYLFVDHLTTLVSSSDNITSNDNMISESGKDMEGSGRGLIEGSIPTFTWRDSGKP